MSTYRVHYRANNKDFGRLLMSGQTQELALKGARAGVVEAGQQAMEAGLPERYVDGLAAQPGPPVTLDGNPRRTARLVATDKLSAIIEFGSGRRRERPQGGTSPAYRILGRAGSKIGSPPIGGAFR